MSERIGRYRFMDAQAVNLDGFAVEDPALGLIAFDAPDDPEPSLVVEDGRVVELDGRREGDFDVLDAFIAAHGLDLGVAPEAMALRDVELCRMLVDPAVPRAEIVRLVAGMTPAKLARALARLRPPELGMAMTKMRARRTPSNQAHVTNRSDDPLLLAADAATAAAFGFREVETTVPVLGDAPSNAVAVSIGAAVGSPGVLVQCSVEEALELELGLRGLVSYAETVSLYGTEQIFVDGDDTPWSKAFLAGAYASRGVKMRVTSGGGAEALMGGAEGRSMFYLEARCVALARAIGAQGVQNGGIDSAAVAGAVPGGVRSLMAENLMVMARNLEACTGNDALMSESHVRRTARTLPILLAGVGLHLQRLRLDPALRQHVRPVASGTRRTSTTTSCSSATGASTAACGRRPTTRSPPCAGVRSRRSRRSTGTWGWRTSTRSGPRRRSTRPDPRTSPRPTSWRRSSRPGSIRQTGLTMVDVVAALDETGFEVEAQRDPRSARRPRRRRPPAERGDPRRAAARALPGHRPQRLRRAGHGVRTGARPGPAEIAAIRQQRSVADLRAEQARSATGKLRVVGPARAGHDPREVLVGVSPAVGRADLDDALRAAGRRRAGGDPRRPRGGGLRGAGRPGQRHRRPRAGRADRGPALRLRHRRSGCRPRARR